MLGLMQFERECRETHGLPSQQRDAIFNSRLDARTIVGARKVERRCPGGGRKKKGDEIRSGLTDAIGNFWVVRQLALDIQVH